jgi:hypothetical protein
MTKRFRISVVLVALGVAATSCDGRRGKEIRPRSESQTPTPRAPLLVTVDHFFAVSSDPKSLFQVFRDTFGLPVAWPFQSYGGFASGGLSVGNAVLEFATWEVPKGETLKTEWKMLAFEPAGDTEAATAELRRRGIVHSEPDVSTYRDAGGKETVGWINTGLSGAGLSDIVFVCDYKARKNVAGMHQKGADELARAHGGPLGVRGVKAIEVGVTDLRVARLEWLKLIDHPGQEQEDVFRFGAGPAVHLVEAGFPGIRRIVLQVDSLERARTFLAQRQMLEAKTGSSTSISPAAIGGLTVTLVGE